MLKFSTAHMMFLYATSNLKTKIETVGREQSMTSLLDTTTQGTYQCQGLTLREECRLRVFENRVLRRIFGPKRDEVTGKWRRLHNKELYAVCSSSYIIRVIK
jgi:hypothetical protein